VSLQVSHLNHGLPVSLSDIASDDKREKSEEEEFGRRKGQKFEAKEAITFEGKEGQKFEGNYYL